MNGWNCFAVLTANTIELLVKPVKSRDRHSRPALVAFEVACKPQLPSAISPSSTTNCGDNDDKYGDGNLAWGVSLWQVRVYGSIDGFMSAWQMYHLQLQLACVLCYCMVFFCKHEWVIRIR